MFVVDLVQRRTRNVQMFLSRERERVRTSHSRPLFVVFVINKLYLISNFNVKVLNYQ